MKPGQAPPVEDLVLITQLPPRYALAIDSRDLDLMASLFSSNANWGKVAGEPGLRLFFDRAWRTFGTSIHRITNHVVGSTGPDTAEGIAYCLGEQQGLDGNWRQLSFAYWDQYVRQDGQWFFLSRQTHFWHVRPLPEAQSQSSRWEGLPDAWPSWKGFWS